MKKFSLLAALGLILLTTFAFPARAQVKVYVAYAENERPPVYWPDPWMGSPNTIFLGYGGPGFDTGAILFRNVGLTDMTLGPGAKVDGFANGASFQLWDSQIGAGVTLHPGQNLILTQTGTLANTPGYSNFDTSDQPITFTPNAAQPVIHVTWNGVPTSYTDTAQVLNTGGFDTGDGLNINESLNWRLIGTTGMTDPAGTGVGALPSVLTQHNDMRRTGANLNEQILNTSNVNVGQFGLTAVRSVDGQVYAQPLYVPNVAVPGKGTHNIVFVATEHDSVYAYDADDPYQNTPLWRDSFINPAAGVTTVTSEDVNTEDIQPEIGITGTPVIDPSTGTLYVVAKTKEIINGNAFFPQRLHALDIATGQERPGSPVVIQGAVAGSGDGNDGDNHVHFNTLRENQRAGLLLLNGVVYIAWASHGDNSPYHGWVIGYDAHTLAQTVIYCTNPNGGLDGIWQGGNGLVADSSDIYLMTGNGTSDPQNGGSDYGECFLKLKIANGLTVADWFMPYNFDILNQNDTDLGSAGPMLIPGTNLLVGCGKQGVMYLLNTGNMGHFQAGSDSQIVQSWQANNGEFHDGPIYWNSVAGPFVYAWGSNDYLKAYAFNGSTFNTAPAAQSTVWGGWPGGGLSLSANGVTPGTGIVWAYLPEALRAFDASNVATELWDSGINPARDATGAYTKFSVPTVANGRVYAGTSSNRLNVYGLLPGNGKPDIPNNLVALNGNQVSLSWSPAANATAYNIYRSTAPNGEGSTPYQTGIAAASFTDTGTSTGGAYYYKVSAVNANGESPQSAEVGITLIPESPYLGTAVSLPGLVEAENYDNGGEGLAYHDVDASNNGGGYRSAEGVDLEATPDNGGGYDVGWTAPGEWIKYAVNAAAPGIYTVSVRLASPNDGCSLHIEFNGVNATGPITVPNTGGYQNWQTVSIPNVSLAAGPQTMRVVMDTGGFNLNWVAVATGNPVLTTIGVSPNPAYVGTGATSQFTAKATDQNGQPLAAQPTFTWAVSGGGAISASGLFTAGGTPAGPFTVTASSGGKSGTASVTVTVSAPYTGAPVSLPGKIEAENYDLGGEGVAYHDFDTTNNGTAYRPNEGVDLAPSGDTNGGYTIGWIRAGEWVNYTVNVAASGTYTIAARVATPNSGTSFHIEVNGVNITGPIAVPNTGWWLTWQTVAVQGVALNAGTQTWKFVVDPSSIGDVDLFNINYLAVSTGIPSAATVSVSPSPAYVPVNGTKQFSATVYDQNGTALSPQPAVTWTVSGGGTVNAGGLFTAGATAGGPFTVTATAASVSGTSTLTVTPPQGSVNITAWGIDNARSNLNPAETALTPANVNPASFGRLFTQPVDGEVRAQPLILTGVAIPGQGTHNVLYAATAHDSVYAFDADNNLGSNYGPLWHVSFINPAAGVTTVPAADPAQDAIPTEIGITGTPVIDVSTNTLYVVAATKETRGPAVVYVQRLHALDVATGAEKFGGPVVIQPMAPGLGDGSIEGVISFDPLRQNQRAGLVLAGGQVFISYASHNDNFPCHGWLVGFDAKTLAQTSVLNLSPEGTLASIWQSGAAPAVDANGNLFFATGNGTFDAGGPDWGDSILRVTTGGGLAVADSFTPYNQDVLDAYDTDVGSGGVLLLPDQPGAHPHLLVQPGKDGNIHLVDRDNMGGFNPGGDTDVQTIAGQISGCWSSPAYWNGNVYFQAQSDHLKAFTLANGQLSGAPASVAGNIFGYPGATPVVSADGAANGIVWTMEDTASGSGVLHAYDGANLTTELYNTTQQAVRDDPGLPVKFVVPAVANGKVYAGAQNEISVYGLNPASVLPAPVISSSSGSGGITITISDAVSDAIIRYTTDGTDPTPSSLVYTAPFAASVCTDIRARAVKPGSLDSAVTDFISNTPGIIGAGDGLAATYFSNIDFTGSTVTRVDWTIDFGWANDTPAAGIGPENFSARWTGYVLPLDTATYTFATNSDDGVRLWVNGQQIINNWTDHAPTLDYGSASLSAGQPVPVTMEYYQHTGGATAQLSWSNPCRTQVHIPRSQLYSNLTVSVAPATSNVNAGSTQKFTATVKDAKGVALSPQPVITWSVSGGGTIDSNGLFTASKTAGGPFTVTAACGALSGTASATVVFVPILTSITLSPASASVNTGATKQFTATAKDQNGVAMAVQPTFTWSVSGGGTINSSGLFTANNTAGGGPFAVSAASGSKSGTASVMVVFVPVLTTITVSPPSASVGFGATQQFTATAKDQNGAAMPTQPTFTWAVASGGSINSSGLFTAGSAPSGPSTVTASSGGKSGTAFVSVTFVPILTTIAVAPATASIKTGATQQFTATAKDQNGAALSVQPTFAWTVSGGGIINSAGLFTAGSVPGGPFIVTATSGGKSGTASLVVTSGSLNDFNGDGKPDLVLQNPALNKAALWYLNGVSVTGSAYVSLNIPAGWKIAGEGDFNGDGKPDLVLQNAATRQIALWYMNGATVSGSAYVSATPAAGWAVAGVGDANHDGKPDLILQNSTTHQIAFWYMNGPLLVSGAFVSLTPAAVWKVIGEGDFNSDGKLDLALVHTSTNQVAIWYLNGATLTGGGYVSITPPATWKPAGIGDFNNDGKPDLILQSATTNQVAVWYLNNAALLTGAFVSIAPPVGWSVAGPR